MLTDKQQQIYDYFVNLQDNINQYTSAEYLPADCTIGDILTNDRRNELLFKAYPAIKDLKVRIFNDKNDDTYGCIKETIERIDGKPIKLPCIMFNAAYGPDEAAGTAVHEIQHLIQSAEGFARGTSPEGLRNSKRGKQLIGAAKELSEIYKEYIQWGSQQERINEIKSRYSINDGIVKALVEIVKVLQRTNVVINDENIHRLYIRFAGEQEARDAAARRNYSIDEIMTTLSSERNDGSSRTPNENLIPVTLEEMPEENDSFSIRTKPAPKKTGKGYKVFVLKDGKL